MGTIGIGEGPWLREDDPMNPIDPSDPSGVTPVNRLASLKASPFIVPETIIDHLLSEEDRRREQHARTVIEASGKQRAKGPRPDRKALLYLSFYYSALGGL